MQLSKKVNYIIKEDIRREFEKLVAPGERSKVVNNALRKELLLIKRKELTKRLFSLRSRSSSVSTREIIDTIKRDRSKEEIL